MIGLHGLDAAAQVYRLCVTAAHVLVYLFLMGQAVGKHGIYVSEAQRFVRLNDRLRSRPTAKCIYYHFQQHPGVSYSIDPRGLLSERDSHGFDGWHGREMISHFVVIIARRYLDRNAGSPCAFHTFRHPVLQSAVIGGIMAGNDHAGTAAPYHR